MKKLALLLLILGGFAQGALATVTITYTGSTCSLMSMINCSVAVSGASGPFTYNWTYPYDSAYVPTADATLEIAFAYPGVYQIGVEVEDGSGNIATDTVLITITDACTNYVTISGYAYQDLNENCIFDAGEPPYDSTIVECSGYAFVNTLHYLDTADASGYYSLSLPQSSFIMYEMNAGGPQVIPNSLCTDLSLPLTDNISADTIINIAMRPIAWAQVSGRIYSDQDGDCMNDSTEYGYPNRIVSYSPSYATPFPVSGSVQTDANGYYSFSFPTQEYLTIVYQGTGFTPLCPSTYYINEYVGGYDTLVNYDFSVTTLPATLVSGYAYTDQNADCSHNPGETGFSGRPVHIQSSGGLINTTTYTGPGGYYHVMLPYDSTYTVSMDPGSNLAAACPATGAATIALTPAPLVQDFALNCLPAADPWDLAASGWATNFNLVANRWVSINLQNVQSSCMNDGAVLKLSLHPALSPAANTTFGWTPDSIIGQDIYWHVDANTSIAYLGTAITVTTDGALAGMGDTLCNTLTIIHNTAPDANAINDTAVICGVVNGSFDPNDKAVSPQGAGPQGYIAAQPQTLSYLIRFQNTGTDTAYNIVVRDTLSTAVDWSTLKVLNASHPINMTQGAGGAVAFNFPNILLPDSNVNEAASHGFVAYSVKMHDSLAPGTPIVNTAYIYFDNNAAVVTNTTLNTIELQDPAGVQSVRNASANIFPNPANEWLHIASQDYQSAVLTDASGRTLRTASGHGGLRMNVRELPEGIYWLKLSGLKGMLIRKVTVAH